MVALASDEGQYAAGQRADVSGCVYDPLECNSGAIPEAELESTIAMLCDTKYLTGSVFIGSLELWR